jgi:hypothetical protein
VVNTPHHPFKREERGRDSISDGRVFPRRGGHRFPVKAQDISTASWASNQIRHGQSASLTNIWCDFSDTYLPEWVCTRIPRCA